MFGVIERSVTSVGLTLHSHVTWGHTNNWERVYTRERDREREIGGGIECGQSKGEEERERRKSQHITRRTRGKVVIRIALVSPPPHPPALSKLLSLSRGSGNIFLSETITLWEAVRMEWNEVDLVQEFTVEGQCSKIKVRSCRITWDSLQVNTSTAGTW